jgi:class 3 adenylate cyclase
LRARFPLGLKIGAFAVPLVVGACAAVWFFAVYQPALRERARRDAGYSQLALMLGASGALGPKALSNPGLHPDLAFVVRARGQAVDLAGSVAHIDRLGPLDPILAKRVKESRVAGFARLLALSSGELEGLVVKRVTLKPTDGSDPETIVLGFSTLALDRELRERLRRSLLVLAASLMIAIGGAFLIGAMTARPVRRLAAAMERIGKGRYEPVAIRSEDEVGLLARAFNEMVKGLKERERLKGTLARYVSDEVASSLLTKQSDLDLIGELREVTVLFLDIRGFTSLSERMPPRELVAMLNEYFKIVIEIVYAHHGTVNKFIGDAVMAIYGAPRQIDDPVMRAVRTAVDIESKVALFNQLRRAEGQETVTFGAGINTGLAIAGNIGSERRMEYTVIGDEVNLAQRLESLAREGEIVVSAAIFDKVKDRVEARAREPVMVKGKSVAIPVYEVIGLKL